ncbi:MAG: hypothetical protein AAFQ51_06165 [Pseudomonadota bacterium]
MSGYFLKSPGSQLDYALDWSVADLKGDETVTADLGWTITPEGDAEDLRVVSRSVDPTRSIAMFEGGVPGRIYAVRARVETSTARVLERSIVVRVGGI